MGSLDEFSREQAILTALRSSGRVAVNDLARQLGVSAVTIRKDLNDLERRSLLRRVRGGAVGGAGSNEGSFETRLRDSRTTKQAIARAAADIVHDGDVIAIDSSTTAFHLACELLDQRNLLVVTNSLRVTTVFAEQSTARVLVLVGVLRRSAGSLVGPLGDAVASRGRIAKGFFGLVGLSSVHGLPEMLEALAASGWRDYHLYLRSDGLLVGTVDTDGFSAIQRAMADTEVNARWQAAIAPSTFERGTSPDR
jgi:DeoR family transcriptional regulator of aga operon